MSKNKNKNKNRNKNIDDKGKNFRTKPLIIGISTLILLSSIIAGLILLTGTQDTQAEIPTPNLGDLELEDSETKEEQTEETEPEKKTSIVTSSGSSNRPPPPPPLYTFKETIINEIRSKNVILEGEDGLKYYLGSNDDLTLPNGSQIYTSCITAILTNPSDSRYVDPFPERTFGERSRNAILSCVETDLNPFLDFITNTTSFFEETIPEMRSKERSETPDGTVLKNLNVVISNYLNGLGSNSSDPLGSGFLTYVGPVFRDCGTIETSNPLDFDGVRSCWEIGKDGNGGILNDLIRQRQKALGWCDGKSDEDACYATSFGIVKSDLQRRDVLDGIDWDKIKHS